MNVSHHLLLLIYLVSLLTHNPASAINAADTDPTLSSDAINAADTDPYAALN